jgi:hypothetical protein
MLEIPEPLKFANLHREKTIVKGGLFTFIVGLLLPSNWAERLGISAEPISWAALHVPSVSKMVAASPIGDVVQGFFGIAALLLPIFYLLLVVRDPIGLRFEYALNRVASGFKFIWLVYFVVVPTLALLVYFIVFWPFEVRLGLTPTRGQMLLSLMISYRFTLALFGSFLIVGTGLCLWMITIYLVGPFSYFFKRMKRNVK